MSSRTTIAKVPLILALGLVSATATDAGCHLIDCVENVYVTSAEVENKSCEDLWILRNSIYKDAKYCFGTERAKSFFGNQGCEFSDQSAVPLNDYQRHNVDVFRSVEQQKGC